ncbi:D-Ala-D-Ala dipeptidase [Silvanigrella paludirubra]|uniref:D-alanyl-D-alanine dipeptidase n=1 Tax=Silvanigrella paludirubra TaxID=2499159 RepID=A0A6N6VQ62_9BACT|nr:M15 family metallopeptidase [Silvanigrella paludirubra]KAB8037096.1 D-Ala-D-Ala dipeptidase [Silvanigrella paludirubra]
MIKKFSETPIFFEYKIPSENDINWLKNNSNAINVEQNFRIKSLHTYKNMKINGTQDIILARQAVVLKLNEALELLPNEYTFAVFDAFRTIETQFALFRYIYNQQKQMNPSKTHSELYDITREFVIHPNETSRYAIPPHNSGGALDLTLKHEDSFLDMGTDFDAVTPASYTNFFEQEFNENFGISKERWLLIRKNRRILFNSMKYVGFTNFQVEWWHFDLGDCMWAKELEQNWYFHSMEKSLK